MLSQVMPKVLGNAHETGNARHLPVDGLRVRG
jgi:hypothetical protein